MGTRSTILFCEKRNLDEVIPIVKLYFQYDGYPEGVGEDLCNYLLNKTIVNGFSFRQSCSTDIANGVGCLVAQYIRDNKKRVGDFYVIPIDIQLDYIDYNYIVVIDSFGKEPCNAGDVSTISVNNWGGDYFFTGTPKELIDYIKNGGEQ